MNDRFKFRVWDKQSNSYTKEKKFYIDDFGGLFKYEKSKSTVYINSDNPYIMCLCSDRYICEQCTGLKDKNGKLIYEGDIVKFENEISEVKWCINGFAIDDGIQYLVDDMDIEVIGNVHENKELLNEIFNGN